MKATMFWETQDIVEFEKNTALKDKVARGFN